jgi:outer membrane protein TolC
MSISTACPIHISPAPRALRRVALAIILFVPMAVAATPSYADERPPAGGKLSLARAEAIALEHQPAVAEAAAQTEASEGRVEQARAG